MKTKMIYSNFDKETGKSEVIIATKIGNFSGYAKCHPEDDQSNFFGCQIAEYRANIKAFKELKRLACAQLNSLETAYKTFELMSDFDANNKYVRRLRKACRIKEKEIAKYSDAIENLSILVQELPKLRKKTIKDKFNKVKND